MRGYFARVLSGTLLVTFLGLASMAPSEFILKEKESVRNHRYVTHLIGLCNQKVAGLDGVISKEEGIEMARTFGYYGVHNFKTPMKLIYFENNAFLDAGRKKHAEGLVRFENHFNGDFVSIEDMEKYLRDEKKGQPFFYALYLENFREKFKR